MSSPTIAAATEASSNVEDLQEQLKACKNLVEENPNDIEAHFQLGVMYAKNSHFEAALQAFQHVMRKDWTYKTVNLERADCYEQLGFFDRALASLEDVPADNQDPKILNRLGNLWWKKNDLPKAIECFELSVKQQPEQPDVWFDLSRVYYVCQQYKESEQAIQHASKYEPENKKFLIQKGLALCATQHYQSGFEAYKQALKLGHEGIDLQVNLGNCCVYLKRLEDAEGFYRKAMELDKKQPEVLFNLAEFLFLHKPSAKLEAQQLFQQILAINPKDADVWGYMAQLATEDARQSLDCWKKAIANGFVKAKAWPYMADLHEQLGNTAEAFKVRGSLAKINPYHPENNYRYGWLLVHKQERAAGWQCLKRVQNVEPNDAENWWRLAQSFRLDKNYTAEVHCIQLLLKQQKDEPSLWNRLAEIALENQLPLKALEYINKVKGQFPSDLQFWQELAVGLLEQNAFDQALSCAVRFEKVASHSALIWRPWVKAFKRFDQLEQLTSTLKLRDNQAIIAFAKSLESLKCFSLAEQIYHKQPTADPEIVVALAQNLAAQKLFGRAQQRLEQALMHRVDSGILNGLADIFIQQKEFSKAQEFCDQALKVNQDDHRIWLNLGILAFRQTDLQLALKHYDQSITLYAYECRSWHGRGVVLAKLDQPEKAQQSLQKAVQLNRQYSAAWNLLGRIYYQAQKFGLAKHAFLRSLSVSKTQAPTWKNLASVFEVLKEPNKQSACLKQWRELSQS